jgi:hypothetical protein
MSGVNSNFQRFYRKLQDQKASALASVAGWSSERLNLPAGPGEWSTLDVLDHVVKVENAWVGAVGANLAGNRSVTLWNRIAGFMVICITRSPMRVKVPAGAASRVLPEPTDLATITKDWATARQEMGRVLHEISGGQLRCGVFKHPVSGWMTASQSLNFLCAHLRHHVYQLERLERKTRREMGRV